MLIKNLSWRHLYLSAIFSLVLASCSNDDDKAEQKTTLSLSGNANGANERPNPITTNGTGTISGTYDQNTNTLTYTINWSNLSGPPIAMHFHGPADLNTAAGVAVGIALPTNPAVAGTVSGTASLTDQQETELLGGLWYYNIHTDQNKGGEIRGQVTAR